MELYCTTCRAKRKAQNIKDVTLPSGEPAREGDCPVCGAKLLEVIRRNACQ